MFSPIQLLFILAIPVACISFSITHEEIFREPREYCVKKSKRCKVLFQRKFYFVFTCEYCLSHYITVLFLCLTNYKLVMEDWKGYVIAGFSIVWIANAYMSIYAIIRQIIKKEKTEINL